jgi:pSer/pThr/pTyr-binding forkhead associated (FHA) protein
VGRRVDLCNLVIEYDRSVSGRHCEIVARDGRFFVNDLQSKNGTYINNSKIVSETEIFSGNILRLGMLEMRFDVR